MLKKKLSIFDTILSVLALIIAIFTVIVSFQAIVFNPTIGFCALLSAFLFALTALFAIYYAFFAYSREGDGSYFILLSLFLGALFLRILAAAEFCNFTPIEYFQVASLVIIIGLCTPFYAYQSWSKKVIYICIIVSLFCIGIYLVSTFFSLSVNPTSKFPLSICLVTPIVFTIIAKHKRRSDIIRQVEETENN